MADVFISYRSTDRPLVEMLAQTIANSGYSVWYDRGLGGDVEYHKQIAEELTLSSVVVAVWSKHSSGSRWVYSEADEADRASKLINVSIDGELPPKPFDRLNSTNLSGWSGAKDDPYLRKLFDDIARLQARAAGARPENRALPSETRSASAWRLIQSSLNIEDYRRFLELHGGSPQRLFAEDHIRDLEEYLRLDHTDERIIREFMLKGPFDALSAHIQRHIHSAELGRDREARKAQLIAESKGPLRIFKAYYLTLPVLILAIPVMMGFTLQQMAGLNMRVTSGESASLADWLPMAGGLIGFLLLFFLLLLFPGILANYISPSHDAWRVAFARFIRAKDVFADVDLDSR